MLDSTCNVENQCSNFFYSALASLIFSFIIVLGGVHRDIYTGSYNASNVHCMNSSPLTNSFHTKVYIKPRNVAWCQVPSYCSSQSQPLPFRNAMR
jgi:hypothetical protein